MRADLRWMAPASNDIFIWFYWYTSGRK